MSALAKQVESLDPELFSFLEAQSSEWDRRALLALQASAAEICGSFSYLEIGSYLGGSLQAVMRDPRCTNVVSIDPRPAATPDARGLLWEYADNSTEHMLELLRTLPDVDMKKLTTFEADTSALSTADLPTRPDYCFVDGEHSDEAVSRDARFCAEALDGTGVIAFHDYSLVGSAISAFLAENWREITFALAFAAPSHPVMGGGVFALELGGGGLLKHSVITRAVGSRWHAVAWDLANWPRSPFPFLLTWATIPAMDSFILQAQHGLREYVGGRSWKRRQAHSATR